MLWRRDLPRWSEAARAAAGTPHSLDCAPTSDWLWYLRPFEVGGVIEVWPSARTSELPAAIPDPDGQPTPFSVYSAMAYGFLLTRLLWGYNFANPPVIAYGTYRRDVFDPAAADSEFTVTKQEMHSADLAPFVVGEPVIAEAPLFPGWWVRVGTAVEALGAIHVKMTRHETTRCYNVRRNQRRVGAGRPTVDADLRQTLLGTPVEDRRDLLAHPVDGP